MANLPPASAEPSGLSGLLQGNPALMGMAESMLGAEQVSGLLSAASGLGGAAAAAAAAASAGTSANTGSAPGAAAVIDNLTSTAEAVISNPQLGAMMEGFSELAQSVRAPAADGAGTANAGAPNLAAMMQGLLGDGGDGGGFADVASNLMAQFAAPPPQHAGGATVTEIPTESPAEAPAEGVSVPTAATAVTEPAAASSPYPSTAPPNPQ
mmetsp:Transcript_10230/g.30798  ORF Transcript_10230/g.30798 Transcript_10230/m.30798 type:complete len:210 (+) Transcript_10230:420-1049(+)